MIKNNRKPHKRFNAVQYTNYYINRSAKNQYHLIKNVRIFASAVQNNPHFPNIFNMYKFCIYFSLPHFDSRNPAFLPLAVDIAPAEY